MHDEAEAILRTMMNLADRFAGLGMEARDIFAATEMLREALRHELIVSGMDPSEIERVSTDARLHAQTFIAEGPLT